MKSMASALAIFGMAGIALPGCATMSTGEYTTHWSHPEKTQTLQLSNGFTVRYLQTGNGPPLVLLHTIRTQLDYFRKLIPALSDHYEVYALDLPGHGQSSILSVEYTEALFRESVTAFITQLNLHDVTLAGESIGGVLALTVSAELPDRVTNAVALNPYDYGERFGGGVRRGRSGWIVSLFNVFGAYTIEPRFVLAAVIEGGFHDPARLPEDLLTEFHRTGQRPGYRRAEYSVFKNWQSWIEARKIYPRISVPVTLAYSDDDWSRPGEREQTRRAIGNAELITIDNSGHFAVLEKPAEVADIILSQRAQQAGQ